MAVKQTAGRDALGEFAPKFAQLNDDVLFGEVWSREEQLSLRDRSLVTIVALMAQGLVDSSFQYHLATARKNGITRQEIAEILTHAAFYAGWPKAWAAFRMARKFGPRQRKVMGRPGTRMTWSFPSGHPTTPLPNILWDRAICSPSLPVRWGCIMSHLSRAAATTGTSTMRPRAADRSWSA